MYGQSRYGGDKKQEMHKRTHEEGMYKKNIQKVIQRRHTEKEHYKGHMEGYAQGHTEGHVNSLPQLDTT